MLKQRLITAAILIPLVIWAIFSLSSSSITKLLAVLALVAAWEWSAMIALKRADLRLGYVVLIGLAIALVGALSEIFASLPVLLLSSAVVWWGLALMLVLRYGGEQGVAGSVRLKGALIGIWVIVPWWYAMSTLHGFGQQGPWWLFFLILLTAVADSGAYFAGRRWGRRKLAPRVSPGKTIEGVMGALAASLFVALIAAWSFGLSFGDLFWFLPLCLLTVAVSVVGDLLESLFKRRVGLKDSGHILPGHGGILDRIDSHTAAAPLFALGLTLFGSVQ